MSKLKNIFYGFIMVILTGYLSGDVIVKNGQIQSEGLNVTKENQELVDNGEFDEGLASWTELMGSWITGEDDGDYYVIGDNGEYLSQTIPVDPNTTYSISSRIQFIGGTSIKRLWVSLGGVSQYFTQEGVDEVYITTVSNADLILKPFIPGGSIKIYEVEVKKVANSVFGKAEVLDSLKFGNLSCADADAGTGINALSLGKNTLASGNYSLASGENSVASGQCAVAMGRNATASGSSSVAMGYNVAATNSYALAIGVEQISSGYQSVALGGYSEATSNSSVAIGQYAKALADRAYAFGYCCTNTTANSFAVGYGTYTTPKVDFRVRSGQVNVYGNLDASGTIAAGNFSANGQQGIDATFTIKDGDDVSYHHLTFTKGILTAYTKDTTP